MKEQDGFILLEYDEIKPWIDKLEVNRVVDLIQNHHTFIPDYSHFNGSNHFDRVKAMKNYHVNTNGWSDIGQNITTFSDGTIVICRSFDKAPACIKGANSKAICMEHLGNFDSGGDVMSAKHKEVIIHLNAVLCNKFGIAPDSSKVVYHHWYDLVTGKRTDGSGTTKTCPGTNFFGGNDVDDANKYFFPLVKKELQKITGTSTDSSLDDVIRSVGEGLTIGTLFDQGIVNTKGLNVRKGPGMSNEVVDVIDQGTIVAVYEREGSWSRIGKGDRWVASKFIDLVRYGKVDAPDGLNVRTGPGISHRVVDVLEDNEAVSIFETEEGWHRIAHRDMWVYGKYININ